jgi:hypothetical protein
MPYQQIGGLNMSSELKKDGLLRKMSMGIAQSIFSRKNNMLGKIFKSMVLLGVTLFQKRYGFMKDEIIDADIGFTAEELDAYQFPEESNK